MIRRNAALLVSALALSIVTSLHAGVIVSEVDPAGSSAAYAADWFELTNTGASPVDITGWKMDDSSNAIGTAVAIRTTGTISTSTIAPGQSVVFAEGGATNANDATIQSAFITAWFGGTAPANFALDFYGGSGVGLSTAGDGVNLFDSTGTHVAGVSFGSTATFAGATLDNAAGLDSVTISTASVAGTNGAFSDGTETGSPGTIANAVPEPASLSVMALAGVTLLARRRR